MTIKEVIETYEPYKYKQPLTLKELVAFVKKKVGNRTITGSTVRNILLDERQQMGYYSSYAWGVYLPFVATREEEVIQKYFGDIYPIGRFLAAKLRLTNQAFTSGSYVVFSKYKHMHNGDELIKTNNYIFVSNISKEDFEKMMTIAKVMEYKRAHSLPMVLNFKDAIDWYINDYPNVLKTINVEVKEHNGEFKYNNPQITFLPSNSPTIISYAHLPTPTDYELIGMMYVQAIRGKHE